MARSFVGDPVHYDACHAYLTADLAVWASLVQPGARVLELGCGTGRIATALARAGAGVTALDISPAFVEHARGKSDVVEWLVGDMREFSLARRDYELVVIGFNTLNVLTTSAEQLACLETARAHLAPDGRIAIDISVPVPDRLRDTIDEPVTSYTLPDGTHVRVTGSRTYDPVRQLRRLALSTHAGNAVDHDVLETHVTYPCELELLLARAGFVVEARHGDYQRGPLAATSKQYIAIARRL